MSRTSKAERARLSEDVKGQGALFPESAVPRRRSAPPKDVDDHRVPAQRDRSTGRPARGRR